MSTTDAALTQPPPPGRGFPIARTICKQKAKIKAASPVWYHRLVRLPVVLGPVGVQPFDAVGFGLNTTDLLAVVSRFPDAGTKGPVRDLTILPGGQAATAMTAVSRLGWSARYVGCFGDDANGQEGREAMLGARVDVAACKTAEGTTNALSFILVDEQSGQRTVSLVAFPRSAPDAGRRAGCCRAVRTGPSGRLS